MRTGRDGGRAAARAIVLPGWLQGHAAFRTVRVVSPGEWLRACLAEEVERRRLFPWIAVAYGAGIVLASVAEGSVSPWPPLVLGGLCTALAVALRARPVGLAIAIACAAVLFGFTAMVVRTVSVEAPILGRMGVAKLAGFVEEVEERQAGGRIVIRVVSLDKHDAAETPKRVRVTTRRLDGVAPGDYVSGTARLLPPPEAARPGGYDFARDAYFRGIGAVGSISGRLTRVEPPPLPRGTWLTLVTQIDRARNALTARIAGVIGGQSGAVAAALITGKRGLIDEHSNDILRAAGIYHIVSISGLHMVLAAGVFFWITRALLALSPTLALRWPIKKIAALAGMAGATAYDIFSGSDVATERSLLMILVMQGAILFDRPALSLRNLAISALIVLTREPETLLGPSLQMSYAAVAGLIALAEWSRRRHAGLEAKDLLSRALRWLGATVFGTVATTTVATAVTGPFGTFHFQNLQPYGILGNGATLPLVSFVVMPCAVIGTVLYPFGLDRPVWIVMGWGCDAMMALSEWVAGLSGSVVIVPAFGTGALLWLVAAMLIATLFVSGLRWLAFVPLGLGLALAWRAPHPDVYVARDGTSAAIRGASGKLVVVGKAASFTAEQWLRADGDARRGASPELRAKSACDPVGCVVTLADGRAVSFVTDRRAFAEDCRRAAIVVSRLSAPQGCRAEVVVDGRFLAEHGSTALTRAADGFQVATVRTPGETRPWLVRPDPRRRPPRAAAPTAAPVAEPVAPETEGLGEEATGELP